MKKTRLRWLAVAIGLGFILGVVGPSLWKADALQISFDDPNPAARAAAIRNRSRDNPVSFQRAIQDSDPDVRLLAIMHLGGGNSPSTVNTLISLLKDDHAGIRKEAAFALAFKGPDTWPVLRQALRDDEPLIRLGAAKVLENVALRRKDLESWHFKLMDETIPALKALKDDSDPEVRSHAERALEAVSRRIIPREKQPLENPM